ncbi:MAG: polysaccharide deacetylase [Burkholderiales bacterium]|nr:polysaccharide deacetylase [Burkholderiales bacterium]
MPRHIVCLTFDFDAISGFISRGQTSPSWISRGEFGPKAGAPRLIALFRKYGIRTTWFVPGHTIETYPRESEAVLAAGHEIAHHGWTHRPPTTMTRDEEEEELVRGNESIVKLTGRKARGYRSPTWDLTPHSVELFLKHGFVYDSSLMGDDYLPYHARQGDAIELLKPAVFGRETPLVEMPIHWCVDDSPHFEFVRTETTVRQGLMNATGVLENWVNDFLYMREHCEWGVLTYTCHPFIIGRGHRMMMLEKLIRACADNGAVFMAMEDAVAEFRERMTKGSDEER